MTPTEILERRSKLLADSRAILAKAEAEKRDLTGDEQAEYDKLFGELLRMSKARELDDLERMGSADNVRTTGYGLGTDVPYEMAGGRPESRGLRFHDERTGREVRTVEPNERVADTIERRDRPEPQIGRMLWAHLTGNLDALTSEQRLQSVGVQTDGGYLATPEMGAAIIDLARSASVTIRAGARTVAMDTAEMLLARVKTDPTAAWTGEGSTLSSSTVKFEKVRLAPKKLGVLIPATIEMLEDVSNAATEIERVLGAVLGQKLDQAVLVGAGSGSEPLGIANSDGISTTATGIGTATSWDELSDAVRDVLAGNYPDSVNSLAWVTNPRTFSTYDKMTDTTGQNLRPTPWAGALTRFATTGLATTGTGASRSIVGDFREVLIGTRTNGVVVEVLGSGTVAATTRPVNSSGSSVRICGRMSRSCTRASLRSWRATPDVQSHSRHQADARYERRRGRDHRPEQRRR